MEVNRKNVKVEVITPEKAAKMLEGNVRNFRKLSETRAIHLASIMSRGAFHFNGTSVISVREDGTLRDGQTRLRACVLSGKPFETIIYRGPVDDEADIDTGSKRTSGQVLQFHGVVSANSAAAAIKAFIAMFERKSVSALGYSSPITSSEVLEWHKKHPQIDDSVRKAAMSPVGMYQALVAAVHYAGMGIDPAHTEWWIHALTSGEGLGSGNAVLRLRNRFIGPGKKAQVGRIEQAALLIKSWNLSRSKESVSLLQWRGAGPNPEEFPVLGEHTSGSIKAKAPKKGGSIRERTSKARKPIEHAKSA